MKKFSKVILGVVAVLAVTTMFTGCTALFGAWFGTAQTMQVVSSNYDGKEVVIEFEGVDGAATQELTFTIGNPAREVAAYLKTLKSYKLYIVELNGVEFDTPILITRDDSDPDNYATFSDGALAIAGNASYVITINEVTTGTPGGTITATMIQ